MSLQTAATPQTAAPCPIDLDRYPVDRLDSPEGRRLIAEARERIAETGCLLLKDFVTAGGLAELERQSRALSEHAHVRRRAATPYGGPPQEDYPEGHPARRELERTNAFIAGDLIEDGSAARALYHHEGFQRFVAAVVGAEQLYEYADPLAGLVINVLQPGCAHPWHFDNNDFIVTLMTQQPEAGGAFEYCPQLRSAEDQNYPGVEAVLDGERGPVETLDLRPGDLQIFFGRNSLHRVAEVEGGRERHTLILAYAEKPGVIGDPERTRILFGRTTEAHHAAARDGRFTRA